MSEPPAVPNFWMYETTGVLRPAVEAYLLNLPMTPEHIVAMRAYLRQWINSPVWDENPHSEAEGKATYGLVMLRLMVDEIHARHNITQWLDIAMELGIDPL